MIIEINNYKDAAKIINELVDKRIYALYVDNELNAILRPTVTSKGRDTYVIKGSNQKEIDEFERAFGMIFRISKFSFKEDIMM